MLRGIGCDTHAQRVSGGVAPPEWGTYLHGRKSPRSQGGRDAVSGREREQMTGRLRGACGTQGCIGGQGSQDVGGHATGRELVVHHERRMVLLVVVVVVVEGTVTTTSAAIPAAVSSELLVHQEHLCQVSTLAIEDRVGRGGLQERGGIGTASSGASSSTPSSRAPIARTDRVVSSAPAAAAAPFPLFSFLALAASILLLSFEFRPSFLIFLGLLAAGFLTQTILEPLRLQLVALALASAS